jgi:hypothetical protein
MRYRDRGNIGNAQIAGMGTDLHLVDVQFNVAAAVFCILFSASEIPR